MINIAVIGLGNALTPHAKALQDLSDRARVVWAASPSIERTRATADQYGWPTSNDVMHAVTDPTVDAVMLLTPTNAHLELAEAAFGAGKHVLCEKPVEVDVPRAERLITAGRTANRRLAIMLQLRFRNASRRLKALLDDGALGEVQTASMTVPWWRPQAYYDQPGRGVKSRDGGGVLMIQAIHTLDLFRWLVGVSAVDAAHIANTSLHRMETEDYASALLRTSNGAPATMMATVAAWPGSPEQIMIIGSKAVARMDGSNLRVSFLDGTEETIEDSAGSGSGSTLMGFSHLPHRAVIADFLDAIEQNRDPAIPGEEALASQKLIDQIIAKGT